MTTPSANSQDIDSATTAAAFGLASPAEIVRAAPFLGDRDWPRPEVCLRSVAGFRVQNLRTLEVLGRPLGDPRWKRDEDCRVLCLQHQLSDDYLSGKAHLRWLQPELAEDHGFEILRVETRGRRAAKVVSTMISSLDRWWQENTTHIAQELAAYWVWYDDHGGDNGNADHLSPWGVAHTVEEELRRPHTRDPRELVTHHRRTPLLASSRKQ